VKINDREGHLPDWKAEAIRQWSADPCGATPGHPFGSREFFRDVEQERYGHYAPWLKGAVGFAAFAGSSVIEIGFGLGTDYVQFARSGARCFGVDLTPSHVFAARERLRQDGIPMRLVRGDAERLPFRSGSVDAVYSFGVLHHTPGTEAAIDEAHRVLRPGGEAVVALYHRDSAFFWWSCVNLGILRGGFWRDGYRKTLARVEYRAQEDAIPLVKVYSRRAARRLFRLFAGVDVSIHHFGFAQEGRLMRLLGGIGGGMQDALSRWIGWYVMIRARK
jgi:ubiquinone/menaquinone biosynthesis C-methylase UbiE